MANNRAIAYLSAEDDSKSAFASFRQSMMSTEDLTKRLGATLAGVFSVGVITQGVRAIVTEVRNAEQETARLDAVLRATGFASGFVRQELEAMSRALADATTFDDGDIQTAQASLLKFGNIQGEVFERGLRLSADYAAFLGTDIPAAAQLVGKALQSPTEGIGALERNIGKLTGSQDALIKNLVESGRLFEAQDEVLNVLEQRIGGTAAAINTGLTKATSDVGKAWREFLEELGRTDGVGGVAITALDGVTSALRAMRDEFRGVRTPISDFIQDWAKLGRGLPGGGLAGVIDMAASVGNRGAVRRDGPTASGRIAGVLTPEEEAARAAAARAREQAALDAEIAMGAKNAAVIAKLVEEEAKKAAADRLAREKRLQEEGVRGWVQYADAVFAEAERLDTAIAQINAERFRREEEERRRSEQQQVEAIERGIELEREAGLAANRGRSALQEQEEQIRRNEEAGRRFGLTMTSSLEDTLFGVNKTIDAMGLLSAALNDAGRFLFRTTITEPFAGFIGGLAKDLNLSSLFSGFFADGGFIPPGKFGIVGERGMEVAFGGRTGTTIAPIAAAGGGTYYIDARGADSGAIARLERTIRELNGSVEPRAVRAVAAARGRGHEV